MICYQVLDWNEHFESAKSRTVRRKSWAVMPTKQDGLGYQLLVRADDGAALYGAFCALILCLSKQPVRDGWVTDNGMPPTQGGRPLDADDLAIKTHLPAETMRKMLKATAGDRIGWLRSVEVTPEGTQRIPRGYCEDTTGIPQGPGVSLRGEERRGETTRGGARRGAAGTVRGVPRSLAQEILCIFAEARGEEGAHSAGLVDAWAGPVAELAEAGASDRDQVKAASALMKAETAGRPVPRVSRQDPWSWYRNWDTIWGLVPKPSRRRDSGELDRRRKAKAEENAAALAQVQEALTGRESGFVTWLRTHGEEFAAQIVDSQGTVTAATLPFAQRYLDEGKAVNDG